MGTHREPDDEDDMEEDYMDTFQLVNSLQSKYENLLELLEIERNEKYRLQEELTRERRDNQNLSKSTLKSTSAPRNKFSQSPHQTGHRSKKNTNILCYNCRRQSHKSPQCTATPYCSICNDIGHTNKEHRAWMDMIPTWKPDSFNNVPPRHSKPPTLKQPLTDNPGK